MSVNQSDCGESADGPRRLDWFIDSACSDHLINDKSLFESLKRLESPVEIAIAKDGESIVAEYSEMDVKTAFFNGTLTEELYIAQGVDLVCRSQKSLYGLKQASRAWNDCISIVWLWIGCVPKGAKITSAYTCEKPEKA